MKKLLSLALAVVLILGVTVIPASAFQAPNGTALDDCMCDAATIEAIERFNEAVFTDQGFVPDPHIRNWDTSGHLVLIGYDKIHELGIEIDLRTVSGRERYAEYEAKWLAMKNGETDKTTTPPATTPAPTATPAPTPTPTPTPAPSATPAPTPTPTPAPSATPSKSQVDPDFDETVFTDLGLFIAWMGPPNEDGSMTYVVVQEDSRGTHQLDTGTNRIGDKTYAKYKAIRDAAVGKFAATSRGDDTVTNVRFGDDGFFEDTSTVTEPSTVPPAEEPIEPATPTVFPDVAPDAWYTEAVNAMTAAGLIKGDGNGNFRPNDAVTYGEFVTILARVADLPTKATESDPMGGCRTYNCYGNRVVKLGYGITPHWAAWANRKLKQNVYDKMIVNIEDLDCNVVRGHALSVIYKTMEYVGLDMTPVKNYTKADIPDWEEIVGVDNHWGNNVYYIGDHLNFLPDEFIFDLDDSINPAGYDMDDVKYSNPEMKPYVFASPEDVLAMYNLGIVDGVDGAHTCAPLRSMTRAELCVLLYRAGLDHVFHV